LGDDDVPYDKPMNVVRFQGFHGNDGNASFVLDEAPGVLPEVYEAIEGIRAGGDVWGVGAGKFPHCQRAVLTFSRTPSRATY